MRKAESTSATKTVSRLPTERDNASENRSTRLISSVRLTRLLIKGIERTFKLKVGVWVKFSVGIKYKF